MASATLHSEEFIELLERLQASAEDVQRRAAAAADAEFKRQMSSTVVGKTGRLKASLTTNNADHIFRLGANGTIQLGTRDPAARYQRRGSNLIPPINAQPFFAIITAALFRDIRGRSRG